MTRTKPHMPMEAHITEAVVAGDGRMTVEGLPFSEGERVDVIILAKAPTKNEPKDRTSRPRESDRQLKSALDIEA